jgi:hypothetical protein
MLRFLWPSLMFAMTAFVWNYNQTHDDSKLLIPGIQVLVPSSAGDPAAMGEASVLVALGLSCVFLLWTIIDAVRASSRRRAAEED